MNKTFNESSVFHRNNNNNDCNADSNNISLFLLYNTTKIKSFKVFIDI